jgi:predicted O-methyltransferase YrrM
MELNLENLNREHPSAWRGHWRFAEWLVDYLKPSVTVELGVDYGYSLVCLAKNNPGQVYGIDTFEGDSNAGYRVWEPHYNSLVEKINNHGLTNITLIRDRFETVAETWDKPIDILHIDGLHELHAVKNDLTTWTTFVNSTGVVLMHDVEAYGDVKTVFSAHPWPKMKFTHSAGLGILTQNTQLLDALRASNLGNLEEAETTRT